MADEKPAAPTPAPRAPPSGRLPAAGSAARSTARPITPTQLRLRQSVAAREAAARRRRVFNVLLLAIVLVVGLAFGKVVAWVWLAAPVAPMTAWLVACRLMVKRERAARSAQVRRRRRTLADDALEDEDGAENGAEDDGEIKDVSPCTSDDLEVRCATTPTRSRSSRPR